MITILHIGIGILAWIVLIFISNFLYAWRNNNWDGNNFFAGIIWMTILIPIAFIMVRPDLWVNIYMWFTNN